MGKIKVTQCGDIEGLPNGDETLFDAIRKC